jgi:hypothetical protein
MGVPQLASCEFLVTGLLLHPEALALHSFMLRRCWVLPVSSLEGLTTQGVSVRSICKLNVTSRKVVRLFLEQLGLEFVPVFHRLQGRLAAQG